VPHVFAVKVYLFEAAFCGGDALTLSSRSMLGDREQSR